MPAAELVDPMPFSWWWPWVAGAIVVLVAAWFVGVLLWTRRPADAPPEPTPAPAARPAAKASTDPWMMLRATTLARLDEVERRYRAGDVDARGAHLELRAAVREFATVRTGVDTTTMTASQARERRETRPLAPLLEQSSVPAFARSSRTRVTRSLDQARARVRSW
ncbi:hypothetical protein [Cellulomonas iranensis]|uniref:hypothetical protein n=1 Tax=Cellulomonas iranensis TaxID=76862 RepID=UPI000B3D277C|nr:hypothetical protein [Cellulomonas iranensis]